MRTKRVLRVNKLLQRTISQIIQRDLKDPRLGFITVTGVEVTADLRFAKFFISIYGTDEEKETSMRILKNSLPFIRREVGQKVKLKYLPEFQLEYDVTPEHAAHIFGLLDKIKREKQ